jgi:hypothetical protein
LEQHKRIDGDHIRIRFPVFLGAGALAIDFAEANRYKTRLQ